MELMFSLQALWVFKLCKLVVCFVRMQKDWTLIELADNSSVAILKLVSGQLLCCKPEVSSTFHRQSCLICVTFQAVDEFADISAAILKVTQKQSFSSLFFQVRKKNFLLWKLTVNKKKLKVVGNEKEKGKSISDVLTKRKNAANFLLFFFKLILFAGKT